MLETDIPFNRNASMKWIYHTYVACFYRSWNQRNIIKMQDLSPMLLFRMKQESHLDRGKKKKRTNKTKQQENINFEF